jgi:hypothetical protein
MLCQGTMTLATQTRLQLSLYIAIRCASDPLPNGSRALFSITYIYQSKNRLKFNGESLSSYLYLTISLTPLISLSHSFISSLKQELNYTCIIGHSSEHIVATCVSMWKVLRRENNIISIHSQVTHIHRHTCKSVPMRHMNLYVLNAGWKDEHDLQTYRMWFSG